MTVERILQQGTAMQLPAPIQDFFDADREPGGAAPIRAFALDAIVKDEGKAHIGHDAIEAWWNAAKAQYHHRAEPCEIRDERQLTFVRARVTGRFPGSPALFTFAFQLEDNRIAALEISS
jgi:hypothetical protein